MKTLLAILLSLTFTIISFPQEEDSGIQFGFGVGISSEYTVYNFNGYGDRLQIETLPIDMANFSVLIKGSFFRVEPSFGYFTTSTDYSYQGSSTESSTSNIRLGAVIAFNDDHIESMNLYYGIDIGLILSSHSYISSISTESTERSKTDFFVGPAVGGEYLFIKHFSLGGEINLNYISIGQYDSENDISAWAMSTRGMIYLRWYVN